MKLDDFVNIEDSEYFRQLSSVKQNLIKSLVAYWVGVVPEDIYECLTSDGFIPEEVKSDKNKYSSFRTRMWRYRKIFRESDKGLTAFELIITADDIEVSTVYSAIFDKDPLVKYFPIRFPRANKVETLEKHRLIEILKLLKPLTRNYINTYINGEIKDTEYEALRGILNNKSSENYDIVISTLRGVRL